MGSASPTILIIIGVTGDLSTRKLLPAIEKIVQAGAAPEQFKIIGVTRRDVQAAEVVAGLPEGTDHAFLDRELTMYQMDLADAEAYRRLGEYLDRIEAEWSGEVPPQRLFYLSVPPQISQPIVRLLGESGLSRAGSAKLLLEKPFGVDLASAEELIEQTKRYFDESQLYRIDHYVAKEMAQNLIVFREGNSLFKRTWNKDFIASIDIIAHESIGIEGRAAFYEQTGALRDVVQNHLLQLAALTLMETPQAGNLSEVPGRRLAALRQLSVPADAPLREYVRRGQYEEYAAEVAHPRSSVETYVRLTLVSRDPRWQGVPVRLSTGKALGNKTTEIRITYKKEYDSQADQLVISLQPNEGVALHLWTKVPGYEWKVEEHALRLAFKDHFSELPEPYEQVLLDAVRGNHTLFTGSDEVLETWRILAPVQDAWSRGADDLTHYPRGTMPRED